MHARNAKVCKILGNVNGRDQLGDTGVEEDNIKIKIGCELMDWIVLAQDIIQWRSLVNVIMNS
jgi:hypothetical protein